MPVGADLYVLKEILGILSVVVDSSEFSRGFHVKYEIC